VTVAENIPLMGSKSAVACFMSIRKLIAEHPENVWFWTLTFPEVMPYNYAGNSHRNLMLDMAHAQRDGKLPLWGGIKVAEEHTSGHGLHFHWLITPRLPIRELLPLTRKNGFGRVHVHPDPASPKTASYLVKYLCKGGNLPSIRRWACIGNFNGVRVQDIEISSPSVDTYRQAFREALAAGKPKGAAMVHAKQQQRNFDAGVNQ